MGVVVTDFYLNPKPSTLFKVSEGERMGLIPTEVYQGTHALVAADNARRFAHSKKALAEIRAQAAPKLRKTG